MRHTFFALFPSHARAEHALHTLHERGLDDRHAEVRYHERTLEQSGLALIETDGRQGLHRGAVVGATIGGITATILFTLLGMGAHWLLAVVFGMVAGGIMGALLRGLYGTTRPDPVLRQWESVLAGDGVALTVTVDSLEREAAIDAVFRELGAWDVKKAIV